MFNVTAATVSGAEPSSTAQFSLRQCRPSVLTLDLDVTSATKREEKKPLLN